MLKKHAEKNEFKFISANSFKELALKILPQYWYPFNGLVQSNPMIQSVNFKHIPQTNLEIASTGEHSGRLILIRTRNTLQPLHTSTAPRAVYIGTPQRELRQAMRDGHFTRAILDTMGVTMGGKTFTALQKALDTYLKNL